MLGDLGDAPDGFFEPLQVVHDGEVPPLFLRILIVVIDAPGVGSGFMDEELRVADSILGSLTAILIVLIPLFTKPGMTRYWLCVNNL